MAIIIPYLQLIFEKLQNIICAEQSSPKANGSDCDGSVWKPPKGYVIQSRLKITIASPSFPFFWSTDSFRIPHGKLHLRVPFQ